MSDPNRTEIRAADTQVVAGIEHHFASTPVLHAGGAAYTPAELVATIRRRVEAIDRARIARAEWIAASQACEAILAETRPLMSDVKNMAVAWFGGKSEKLADFGYVPRKIVVRTPEELAVITAKALATRKARHTKGPKARLAITGLNPTGAPLVAPPVVIVTPVEAAGKTPQ